MDRKGDWIQTFSGRRFWPLDPRPDDIDILDIAHALSLCCRFAGHCKWHYSVAQHSVYVSDMCKRDLRLAGLLHDAAEAYLGDLVTPVKRHSVLGDEYKLVELRLMEAVAVRFAIPHATFAMIKEVDVRMLMTEKRDVLKQGLSWATNAEPYEAITVTEMEWQDAKALYLETFYELTR